jgi:thiol:disulfide interchange protein
LRYFCVNMSKMRHVLVIILLFFFFQATGQILKPVTIVTETPANVKVGDVVELVIKGTIKKNWYTYSVGFDTTCGPLPMVVTLESDPAFEVVGALVAKNDKSKHDKIFDCDVRYFEETSEYHQKIKVLKAGPLVIKGSYDGQACSNLDGQCVQIEGDLMFNEISATGKSIAAANLTAKEDPKKSVDKKVSVPIEPEKVIDSTTVVESGAIKPPAVFPTKNEGPILDQSILTPSDYTDDSSILGYMILAFLLGVTSLITPCVFPMIPMTVTFFLKEGQSKEKGIRMALVFGLSIILLYTVVGTIFAFAFGAEGLNALATHWLPNLLIFALFIVFALSFLGLFEINAPYQLVNKADRAAEKGGYIGIFFMSATLVLVSFSCTIPLVGNVLVLAAGGELVKPILGMLAYSFAFALPFTLFAMFPEWLKGLPKSGGWLNTVKVSLGLFELALALKFFSIADQTYHWGLLDRDINIGIWIVIFTVLGFYFLGRIRMKSDAAVETLGVGRLMLAIATFSFVIYLIPGLWGAPLKALAGYLPPMYTHDFDLLAANREDNQNEICEQPKYMDFLHLPHGLKGYFDYDQALACARQQNKPLFIDFTGHGCTNCREMEAVVWSDPAVLQRLNNDYVVVALYVDDKTELPQAQWYTSTYDKKVKKTIGKQNADLQITRLNNNAQPFYVLVGADEKVLVTPYSYNRSVEGFVKFLDDGSKKYHELYKYVNK